MRYSRAETDRHISRAIRCILYQAVSETLSIAVNPPLLIDDRAALASWRRQLRTTVSLRNLPTVQFQLEELTPEQNQRVSNLSGKLLHACGCSSGAVFMIAALAAFIVQFIQSGSGLSDITLVSMLSFMGIVVLASLAGKVLGLFGAHLRLLRLASNVHRSLVRADDRQVVGSV